MYLGLMAICDWVGMYIARLATRLRRHTSLDGDVQGFI